ncbi:VTT domain-containing protein, partial [Bacillus sp. SS-TM]
MNFWLAVLAGTLGGTTGPLTLYALGYYGGRPLLIKYGKYFFIKEEQIQKADDFFEKYGPVVAFVGRFVPGVRTLISVPCGMAKMNIWKFSIYTFVAMFPLTTLYVYPFAAKLFRQANIPKRLIPGTIVLGAVTFTMDALPGSPQIQNVIPTTFFKT